MENQFQNIDDYFRRQASGMTSSLTAEEKEGIWAGVAQRQKKRFVPFWWIVAGLGALIALTGFYMYKSTDYTEDPQKTEQSIDVPMAESASKADELSTQQTTSESVITQNEKGSFYEEKSQELEMVSAPDVSILAERHENQLITKVLASSTLSALTSPEEGLSVQLDLVKSFDVSTQTESGSLETTLNSSGLATVGQNQRQLDLLQTSLSPLLLREISLITEYGFTEIRLSNDEFSPMQKWSIEAYSSVSRPFVTIEERSSHASELAAEWDRSFEPQWLYAFGFMTHFHLGDHWSLGAGAEVQSLTSFSTNKEQDRSIKMSWNDQAYFFLNDTGEKVWVGDSVLTTVNSTSGIRRGNTHDRIVIPIQLAYQIPLKKWSLRGGVGLAMSIWQKHNSTIFNEFGHFEKADGEWNTGIAFDGKLSIGVAYAIRSEWELFLQSSLQVGMTDWLNNDFPVSMNMNFAGLSLGTRKYL
ncbi:MAG: hypothetical protein EA362_13020 [Saprospirales bacterium]|nr:MAG: hypothetical protein EA362_13020 [Saprospirales bacterium]